MPIKIVVKGRDESWDERKQEFRPPTDSIELELEHSLVSLSKWESKWEKPYLGYQEKTAEEVLDYIRCMTITPDVDPEIYERLSVQNINDINAYIESPNTATTVNIMDKHGSKEIITSEVLYYQMIAFKIPFECQYWHLNRLFTLIKVCSVKNDPNPKKMPRAEMVRRREQLNAKRKAALKTRG